MARSVAAWAAASVSVVEGTSNAEPKPMMVKKHYPACREAWRGLPGLGLLEAADQPEAPTPDAAAGVSIGAPAGAAAAAEPTAQ